ncbi:hypothetical protein PanWU01x14_298610 [Parasponia andersonii]|uniref:Uncharacterized protein n=1 Tax=Parasponia andersonii TaxID=3476 RepID=A0A2P5AUS7_PARAD|nr:hypothetical protein PanWU01x14_298610 [Parasponia andersonii]
MESDGDIYLRLLVLARLSHCLQVHHHQDSQTTIRSIHENLDDAASAIDDYKTTTRSNFSLIFLAKLNISLIYYQERRVVGRSVKRDL